MTGKLFSDTQFYRNFMHNFVTDKKEGNRGIETKWNER